MKPTDSQLEALCSPKSIVQLIPGRILVKHSAGTLPISGQANFISDMRILEFYYVNIRGRSDARIIFGGDYN